MAGYVRVMLEGVVVGSRIRVVDVIAGDIMVSLEGLVGSRTMEVVMARLDGGMKGIRIRLVDIMVWLGVVLGIRIGVVYVMTGGVMVSLEGVVGTRTRVVEDILFKMEGVVGVPSIRVVDVIAGEVMVRLKGVVDTRVRQAGKVVDTMAGQGVVMGIQVELTQTVDIMARLGGRIARIRGICRRKLWVCQK